MFTKPSTNINRPFKMKKIIDNAINELRLKGIEPVIVNLTENDYDDLLKECQQDYPDITKVTVYNGIEVQCDIPDAPYAANPLLSFSYIASAHAFRRNEEQVFEQIRTGRIFNLQSLKEIL